MLLWPLNMPTHNFFDVVSVAKVDAEERVADILVEILKVKLGRDLQPEFWSIYQSRGLVKILKYTFGQDFQLEMWPIFWRWAWSRSWSWSLVKTLRLEFGRNFETGVWSKNFNLNFGRNSAAWYWSTCDITRTLGSVVPLAMFYFYFSLYQTWGKSDNCLALSVSPQLNMFKDVFGNVLLLLRGNRGNQD